MPEQSNITARSAADAAGAQLEPIHAYLSWQIKDSKGLPLHPKLSAEHLEIDTSPDNTPNVLYMLHRAVREEVAAAVSVFERVAAAVRLGVLVNAADGVREEVAVWLPVRDCVEVCVELGVLLRVAEEDGVAE